MLIDLPSLAAAAAGASTPSDPAFDGVVELDGTASIDLVGLPNAASAPGGWTVSLWVRPATMQAPSRQPEVLLSALEPGSAGWALLLDGRFKLFLGDGAAGRLSWPNGHPELWGAVDRWNHLALVYSPSRGGTLRLYVDGHELMERSAEGNLVAVATTGQPRLGASDPVAAQLRPADGGFRGRIARVVHLDRALSPAELRDAHAAELSPELRDQRAGAVSASLPFDVEAHGDLRHDASGNGRAAQLPGGASFVAGALPALRLPAGSSAGVPAPASGLARNEELVSGGLALWVKLPSVPPGAFQLAASPLAVELLARAWSVGVVAGRVVATLAAAPGSPDPFVELVGPTLAPGRWTFVSLCFEQDADLPDAAVVTLCVDGARTTQQGRPLIRPPEGVGLILGDATSSLPLDLSAFIAWTRCPDAAEIDSLHAAGKAKLAERASHLRDPAGGGLRGRWPLSVPGPTFLEATVGSALASLSAWDPAWGDPSVADPAGHALQIRSGAPLALAAPCAFVDGADAALGACFWARIFPAEAGATELLAGQAVDGSQTFWSLTLRAGRLALSVGATALDLGPAPAVGRWCLLGLSISWTATEVTAAAFVDGARILGRSPGPIAAPPIGVPAHLLLGRPPGGAVALHVRGFRLFDRALRAADLAVAQAADGPEHLAVHRAPRALLPLTESADATGAPPLNDAVGSPGTRLGQASVVPDPWFGQAVRLGPTSDRVAAAVDAPALWSAGGTGVAVWSCAVWVRPSTTAVERDSWLIHAPGGGGAMNLLVAIGSGGDQLLVFPGDGGGGTSGLRVDGRALVRPERWTHLALTLVAAERGASVGAVRLWVDGQRREAVAVDGPQMSGLFGRLGRGAREAAPKVSHVGIGDGLAGAVLVADLRVFGHPLSDGEVAAVLAGAEAATGRLLAEHLAAPIADLHLESVRPDGRQLPDVSGFAHHAELPAGTSAVITDDRQLGRALDVTAGRTGSAPASLALPRWHRGPTRDGQTVEVWTKPFVPLGAALAPVLQSRDAAAVAQWTLSVGAGLALATREIDPITGRPRRLEVPELSRGSWHHVAVTSEVAAGSTAGALTLTLDGEPQGSIPFSMDPAARAGSLAFGPLPPSAGEVPYSGRLALLRVFDRPLSAAELATSQASRQPGVADTASQVLEFSLHDGRQEPALYLLDGPQTLHLELVNRSPGVLKFPALPGSADEGEHHLELRFRGGVLNEHAPIEVTGPEGATWTATPRDTPSADYAHSLFLTATARTAGLTGPISLAPGASWTFALSNVQPDSGGGTRGTRVQLHWRNLEDAQGGTQSGNRLHFMHLVRSKRPDAASAFPLVAALEGGPFLPIGSGDTSAELTVRIAHGGGPKQPMPTGGGADAPRIRLAVPRHRADRPGGLTQADPGFALLGGSHPGTSDPAWSLVDEGNAVVLTWLGARGADGVVELDEDTFPPVGVTISGLDPDARGGFAHLDVRYCGFPDLDEPGRRMPDLIHRVPVLKAPLHTRDPAPSTKAQEALASVGSLGVWGGDVRLHSAAWTAGLADSDSPEAVLSTLPTGGLWVSGKSSPAPAVSADLAAERASFGSAAATSVMIADSEIKLRGDGHKHFSLVNDTGTFAIRNTSVNGALGTRGTDVLTLHDTNELEVPNAEKGFPVPRGAIVLWSGDGDKIPAGWALCDGRLGTPNLVDQFVRGGPASLRDPVAAPQKGGRPDVTLTTDQIPRHSHGLSIDTGGAHSHVLKYSKQGLRHHGAATESNLQATTDDGSRSTETAGAHTHTGAANPTGGGQSFSILPPYYVLCWIMKT